MKITFSEDQKPPKVPDIKTGGGAEVIPTVKESLDDTLAWRKGRHDQHSIWHLSSWHSLYGGGAHVLPSQGGSLWLRNRSKEGVTTVLHNLPGIIK